MKEPKKKDSVRNINYQISRRTSRGPDLYNPQVRCIVLLQFRASPKSKDISDGKGSQSEEAKGGALTAQVIQNNLASCDSLEKVKKALD